MERGCGRTTCTECLDVALERKRGRGDEASESWIWEERTSAGRGGVARIAGAMRNGTGVRPDC